jgi:hypothetical protein
MVWGLVAHLVADSPLQNDWMANNKAKRDDAWEGHWPGGWYYRHPAAYVHAGIHGVALALVFGWVALPLAVVHLVIDTRAPVVWWSRLIGQTQPGDAAPTFDIRKPRRGGDPGRYLGEIVPKGCYDVGTEVRFWTDQVFHIACIAVAALVVSL